MHDVLERPALTVTNGIWEGCIWHLASISVSRFTRDTSLTLIAIQGGGITFSHIQKGYGRLRKVKKSA